ncbi:hypothetical protein EYZ11_005571 [Aspergillus tanneri]|nr:hypothetical protein EYZ11_005571 [Aspergillus tanneri]
MIPLLAHASVETPGLLPAPPMGFNNWARFMCDLNETLFVETADRMVSNGLLSAGYEWINLDDCWMTHERASNGSLEWNSTLFPRGLPWLGEYVKGKGFRFGIYEDAGTQTCGGYPGSLGHEQQDAETFASWGVEYLKLDGCNVSPQGGRTLQEEYEHLYSMWHGILSGMEKPLVFSESAPAYFVNEKSLTDWYKVMGWVPGYGELARHSNDIIVYGGQGSAWDSVMLNYHYNTLVARYQRPGYYNDPDFLIVDHPGLTMDEKRSQFALWASFSAPLIISAYMPDVTEEELAFLTNRALIEVDQDPKAQQATLASRDQSLDVLTRSLANGDRLVTVLNRGSGSTSHSVPVSWLGLSSECAYDAENLWDGSKQKVDGQIKVQLASHATGVYRLHLPEGCETVIPTGLVFNTKSGNCLTEANGSVRFEACKGDESQIWQMRSSGELRPLSQTERCLTARGKAVSLEPCKGDAQKWSYGLSGNLKNDNTESCLTEGLEVLSSCGQEMDSQVFGLPSGVHLFE